ncbi:MAG: hypothetical protein EHM17_11550 [Verrucomicrobiaceae bacterium]|nr:MAG: hypothetical protein EHM17_16905 [Verrucomicrobiaceae bacterium]RPJ31948.1 MAG: hypothetical protein EHM17_14605 [Verrucomicrobiaceae bacterium]RPJ33071.1 MAG: hypothetical protein EHM17_11550 [Verrucomicrobiaceae bacterium]
MKDNRSVSNRQKSVKSAVDKASGKKGMPKPERTPKQTPASAPKAQAPRKAAPSAPKAQAPKKPAPTPRAASKTGAGGTPRGSVTTGPVKATSRPLPKGVQTKRPAGRGPTPAPTPAPVPTPSFDLAGPPRTYTPAQQNAMNNDKRYSGSFSNLQNRLGSAAIGLGNANVGSRTGGIGGSRTVGIGKRPKPGAKR